MNLKLSIVIGDQNYKIFKKKLFKILTDEMEIQDYIDELIVLNKPLKFTQQQYLPKDIISPESMDNMWVLPLDMDSNELKEGIKGSQFDFTESTTNFLKDQLTVRPPHLGDSLQ